MALIGSGDPPSPKCLQKPLCPHLRAAKCLSVFPTRSRPGQWGDISDWMHTTSANYGIGLCSRRREAVSNPSMHGVVDSLV